MFGGVANRSGALAINAAATLPDRWASRPASLGNESTIANVASAIAVDWRDLDDASLFALSWSIQESSSPPLRGIRDGSEHAVYTEVQRCAT